MPQYNNILASLNKALNTVVRRLKKSKDKSKNDTVAMQLRSSLKSLKTKAAISYVKGHANAGFTEHALASLSIRMYNFLSVPEEPFLFVIVFIIFKKKLLILMKLNPLNQSSMN